VLALEFDGWAQVRLATDPDPSDEPRGVSGWTFAVAGEPDLDRIIRFRPEGSVPRSFGPPIGVTTRAVLVDDAAVPWHALRGAAVDLLGDPVFEGRNGLATEDQNEPINPFHLRVAAADAALERACSLPLEMSVQPGSLDPATLVDIGVGSPLEYRRRRLELLLVEQANATTELHRAAVRRRLTSLTRADGVTLQEEGIEVGILAGKLDYEISLDAPVAVADVAEPVDPAQPWQVAMWCGAWDVDALSMFVRGRLTIPTLDA
jgi:hypothetical protein